MEEERNGAGCAGSCGVALLASVEAGDALSDSVDEGSSGTGADSVGEGEVGLAGQGLLKAETGQGVVGASSAESDGVGVEEISVRAVADSKSGLVSGGGGDALGADRGAGANGAS